MKQVFGVLLISAPFLFITFAMYKKDGWKCVGLVWGFSVLCIGMVVGGCYFLG